MKTKFFLLALFFFLLMPTMANAYSLGVYPPLTKIRVTGAVNLQSPIVVTNPTDQVENFKISYRPFTQSEQRSGQARFLKSNELDLKDPLIFQRIKMFDGDTEINAVQLGPKEEKRLSMHIDIPGGETISDYYFSVIFTSTDASIDEQKNKSDIVPAIASNVLLSITNKSKSDLHITDFSTSFIKNKGPVDFDIKVENQADSFTQVHGFLTIKDLFGHIVGRIELKHVNILAHSSRILLSGSNSSAIWPETFLLGPYTANLNLIAGNDEQVLTKNLLFLGTPIQFVITGLIVLSLLIIIAKRVKSRKR